MAACAARFEICFLGHLNLDKDGRSRPPELLWKMNSGNSDASLEERNVREVSWLPSSRRQQRRIALLNSCYLGAHGGFRGVKAQSAHESSANLDQRGNEEKPAVEKQPESLSTDPEPLETSCILSNALRSSSETSSSHFCSTIGVDYGMKRTGVAVSYRGLAPRPIKVSTSSASTLVEELIDIAVDEGADEFVVGLPLFSQGQDSKQSQRVRAFASRLAQEAAAKRGCRRVYLFPEFNSSRSALEYMIRTGSNRRSRKEQLDAYAAKVILQEYFDDGGIQAQLVLPKAQHLQEALIASSRRAAATTSSYLERDDDCFDYDIDFGMGG